MGSLVYLLLMPALFAAPPQIPVEVSKETTFITQPFAGDGLPNYALAIQQLHGEAPAPEQNGAILFWQAMGQCDMSDEEFERLFRKIGLSPDNIVKPLVPLQDKSTIQAIADWLREMGRSADDEELAKLADEYIAWVQANPWTDKDVPPLAKWLVENERAIDLLVEASEKPEFYSPYPDLLVDRTISVMEIKLNRAEAMRRAARALITRAMFRTGNNDLAGAWDDCKACISLGNRLVRGPFLVEQIVAIAVRGMGLKGTHVILSQSDLIPTLARRVLADLDELERDIDMIASIEFTERLSTLDYTLRFLTGRLGGLPEEEGMKDTTLDINVTLRYINQQFDRIVQASRPTECHERMEQLKKLDKEIAADIGKLDSSRLAGVFSQTYRSNYIGAQFFSLGGPAFVAAWAVVDQNQQFSALTKITAALAVYKAEHGHYPKELAALIPSP